MCHSVNRLSLIKTVGGIAVKRQNAVEEVLRTFVGDKLDWKIVVNGVNFGRANVFSRLLGAFMAPLPVLWIRIAI